MLTTWQIILALLIAIALQVLDPVLAPIFSFFNLTVPDDGDYATLLATTSGIGGVFIALYYATVSTVASSIYARVPNNVRSLLARERVGNVYMRFLALLTFICICLLGLRLLGFPRITIAIPVVVIAAGVSIVAFVKLGQRAFDLFDPTSLARTLFLDLWRLVETAKVGASQWYDASFQHFAHRSSSYTLDTIDTIAQITRKESHLRNQPFCDLANMAMTFLMQYQQKKKQIPHSSRWYELRYVHPDWYQTSDTATSMAHQSGTTLQPKEQADHYWIEDRLIAIVLDCVEVNTKDDRVDLVSSILYSVDAYVRQLASDGEAERAIEFIDRLFAVVVPLIAPPVDAIKLDDVSIEAVGLADHLGSLPISVLLGYLDGTAIQSRVEIESRLRKIKWHKRGAIYQQGFPVCALEQLEWIQPRLQFERMCDGKIVSPVWYQGELVVLAMSNDVGNAIQSLYVGIPKLYKKWSDLLQKNKQPWPQAAIASRQFEYMNKARTHFASIEKSWELLMQDRRLEDLKWPDTDVNGLSSKFDQYASDILVDMSTIATFLMLSKERPSSFPDYVGQFLHATGEAIFESARSNDATVVAQIFPLYFLASFKKFEELRPSANLDDWRSQQEFKVALSPVVDVLTLSGYLILFSELHGHPEIWGPCENVWSEYLSDDQGNAKSQWLCNAIKYAESGFEMAHRATLRTGWSIAVNRTLSRALNIQEHDYHYESRIEHDSALVRCTAQGRSLFHDGAAIFMAVSLKEHLPEGVELPPRADDLLRQLARQTAGQD